MNTVKIHFTDGKSVEITTTDAAQIARVLNVDPNGTTQINNSDGTVLIINRNQMTHAQFFEAK
jgi:hypothetical protein